MYPVKSFSQPWGNRGPALELFCPRGAAAAAPRAAKYAPAERDCAFAIHGVGAGAGASARGSTVSISFNIPSFGELWGGWPCWAPSAGDRHKKWKASYEIKYVELGRHALRLKFYWNFAVVLSYCRGLMSYWICRCWNWEAAMKEVCRPKNYYFVAIF